MVEISFGGVFFFNKLCPTALVLFFYVFYKQKKTKKKSLNRVPFSVFGSEKPGCRFRKKKETYFIISLVEFFF